MELNQIIEAILRASDILVWPGVVLLLGWPVRDRLPAVGSWIATHLEQRAFKAQTPLGSFDVGPPPLGSDESLRADGRAIEDAASRATPALADELREIGAELEKAREELEQARNAELRAEQARLDAERRLRAAQAGTDILERRIAAHAAALYEANPSDFARPISVGGHRWQELPGDVALVALAFFKGPEAIGRPFRGAKYEVWVRAAEILATEHGIPTTQPPFTEAEFADILRSTGAGWMGAAKIRL